jgi:hypothetical protein
MKQELGQEVVLLSHVLAHNCNVGFENCRNHVLTTVNGVKVVNLRHMKTLIDEETQPNIVMEFSNGYVIVLDKQEAITAQSQLRKEHFIPSDCSADIDDVD